MSHLGYTNAMEHIQQIKENFHGALKKHGLKNTLQRNHVLDVLLENGALSNAEIATNLNGVVNRATVYRIIELYENMHLVTRIWNGWKSKIELSEQFIAHHHHATCKECGGSIRIESTDLEKVISSLFSNHGFRPDSHVVELNGTCASCAAEANA